MTKPELVLSNTTSFFIGGIPAVFKNAKKYGFKYVEIIPYRWTTPSQILNLEKKYGVEVAGIHLTPIWQNSYLEVEAAQPGLLRKFFMLLFHFYLNNIRQNPGLAIAKAFLPRRPYVIFHTALAKAMGAQFDNLTRQINAVVENIPYEENPEPFFWDPRAIPYKQVLDIGHFNQSREKLPELNFLEIYRAAPPEIIHISYNRWFVHLLPNKKEQEELAAMLKIHAPKYITIETNPLVSIKRAKKLLDQIINESKR